MLRAYVSVGFDPAAFWGLTPRLYLVQMTGAADRLKREGRDRIEATWTGAALARAEKMPPLSKILGDTPRSTPREVVASRLSQLSASLPSITQAQWRARCLAS